MLNRLLPETLFAPKLATDTLQRLRFAQALADEALIRTHVTNALHFVELLAGEVGIDRAIDIYGRELALPDVLASVVANRTLVTLNGTLNRTLSSPIADPQDENGAAESAAPMPELRLKEARRRRA